VRFLVFFSHGHAGRTVRRSALGLFTAFTLLCAPQDLVAEEIERAKRCLRDKQSLCLEFFLTIMIGGIAFSPSAACRVCRSDMLSSHFNPVGQSFG
jgi:hypothetical protein